MRILLVEHDGNVGRKLARQLQAHGHRPVLVETGDQAVGALEADTFDIVLLNRLPPDEHTPQTLARLQTCRHPAVIVLAAQGHDRTKFPPPILQLLPKQPASPAAIADASLLTAGDLSMNLLSHEVWRAGRPIMLTDKEFRLLRLLLEHRGRVVHRDMLLTKVWGYAFDPHTNLIEVHMSKLRGKIDRPFSSRLLKTVRGVGYLIR